VGPSNVLDLMYTSLYSCWGPKSVAAGSVLVFGEGDARGDRAVNLKRC
jgi:hypothetical protein